MASNQISNCSGETALNVGTSSIPLTDLQPNGRGTYSTEYVFTSKCACNRSKVNVLCRNCGFMMFGRVHRQCPMHLRIAFLMDIVQCLQCRAHHFMMQEIR